MGGGGGASPPPPLHVDSFSSLVHNILLIMYVYVNTN